MNIVYCLKNSPYDSYLFVKILVWIIAPFLIDLEIIRIAEDEN